MRAAADKVGYSVRCKRNRKGVFEILNDHGFVIGEGTSVPAIVDFLAVMGKSSTRPSSMLL